MKNFTQSMNVQNGEVEGAYLMKNVQMGINAYDTLCLICSQQDISLDAVADSDFDSAAISLTAFCASINEYDNTTVSVWFDK